MGVQLTPGQRCLLEILQRKLIETLKEYSTLNRERDSYVECFGLGKLTPLYDRDLIRLRQKIKRISGRQKRFTSEIVNGNGNNTIPKESFLKALGLVTRETLQQINSKSNERRRRTTANPRFSHEAIQAKKALQKPRIQPTATREKRNAAAAAAATAAESTKNNNKQSGKNDGQQTSSRNNRKGASASRENSNRSNSGADETNVGRTGGSRQQKASPDEQLTEQDRTDFYNEFKQLGIYFQLRAEEIRTKLKSKEELYNLKYKAYLKHLAEDTGINSDILETIIGSNHAVARVEMEKWCTRQCDEGDNLQLSSSSSTSSPSRSTNLSSSCSSSSTSPQRPPTQLNSLAIKPIDRNSTCRDPSVVSPPQLENWMRCDESLDGLS